MTDRLLEPPALQSLIDNASIEAGQPLIIVDFSNRQNYLEGHIDHSIQLPFSLLLSGRPPVANKIPDSNQLAQLLAYINYRPNSTIVALDDEGGGWAGRFLWTLDAIGHQSWAYLNGGLMAWRASGLSVVAGESTVATNQVTVEPRQCVAEVLQIDDIINGIGNSAIQFWDARSTLEYSGSSSNSKRAGRIPGAIHCEWTSLMDRQNSYRIRADADHYIQSLGFSKDKTQITYCQSHHRSGFTWLVGSLLGYDIKAYDGSWNEWGNLDHTPIECD